MKKLFVIMSFLTATMSFAQMGQIWPVYSRQDFDLDKNNEISKTYDTKTVSQFFMFINNNEFIHVTDDITSLYKIIKREQSKDGDPIYTVVSEAGNTYLYMFQTGKKQVFVYSSTGFAISFMCLNKYETKVFENLNR